MSQNNHKEPDHILTKAERCEKENVSEKGSTINFIDFAHYTDNPAELLEAIERHNPGFLKEMSDLSLEDAKTNHKKINKFSEIQAYATIGIQVIMAIACAVMLVAMVLSDKLGFWNFVGLGVFLAISQSGFGGFSSIVGALANAITSAGKKGAE